MSVYDIHILCYFYPTSYHITSLSYLTIKYALSILIC